MKTLKRISPYNQKEYSVRCEDRKDVVDYCKEMLNEQVISDAPPSVKYKHYKKDDDFTCPYCHTKDEPSSRLIKMESSSLFSSNSYLVEIFKCNKCNREFKEDDINWEKRQITQSNSLLYKTLP